MINKDTKMLRFPCASRSAYGEAAGDFTLPDYQSEIRRILHVFTNVMPPSKYVGENSLELNGSVDFTVCYIGADGGLYSAPLSTQYSLAVPFEGGDAQNFDVVCNVLCESVSTRVSAPRRLSVRARLKPAVSIFGGMEVPELEGGDGIYTKIDECLSPTVKALGTESVDVSLVLSDVPEDTRAVLADARVEVSGCEATRGAIECTGELVISVLCVSEQSGEYRLLEGRAPVGAEAEAEDISAESECMARGIVSELEVNVTDMGIECRADVLFEISCVSSEQVAYTSDAYSSLCECDCRARALSASTPILSESASFTLSERAPLSQFNISKDAQILMCIGEIGFDACECTDGKYTFSGNARLTLLTKDGEGESCAEVTLPVKYQARKEAQDAVSRFGAWAQMSGLRARADGTNLCIDAEVLMSAWCFGESAISVAESIECGAQRERSEAALTVAYVAPDDSTWSIAKRYAVSPTAVLGDPRTDKYVMIE